MKRTLKRIAAVVVALPLAVGLSAGSANASHTVTVPGCFGAGSPSLVICNLTVKVGVPAGAETYQTTIPVCAGTCQNVPVTLVRTTAGEPTQVCYSYNTLGGPTVTTCYSPDTAGPWIDYVVQAVQNALNTVDQTVAYALDRVNYYYYRVCTIAANAADDYDIWIYCGY